MRSKNTKSNQQLRLPQKRAFIVDIIKRVKLGEAELGTLSSTTWAILNFRSNRPGFHYRGGVPLFHIERYLQ